MVLVFAMGVLIGGHVYREIHFYRVYMLDVTGLVLCILACVFFCICSANLSLSLSLIFFLSLSYFSFFQPAR